MNWRIYRLPGSRETWHVDNGPGTQIINVLGYECNVPSKSVDIGGQNVPRAWIEIYSNGVSLHLVNSKAVFEIETMADGVEYVVDEKSRPES